MILRQTKNINYSWVFSLYRFQVFHGFQGTRLLYLCFVHLQHDATDQSIFNSTLIASSKFVIEVETAEIELRDRSHNSNEIRLKYYRRKFSSKLLSDRYVCQNWSHIIRWIALVLILSSLDNAFGMLDGIWRDLKAPFSQKTRFSWINSFQIRL